LTSIYLDPITINNPTGEAWRQCKMGAREMMIRELVRNGIEGCRDKQKGQRLIRIYGTTIGGVQKLSIWNRGGMTLRSLLQFSDINAAIDKRNAVDSNFGRGAKIASILSNAIGMRYRSCVEGRVLEVTLAADLDAETVGRILVDNPVPGTSFVRDVTSEYASGGLYDFINLETDWTEVTLLGNEVGQDTTQRPFLDAALPSSLWLVQAIGFRFFDLDDGVDLKIAHSITRSKGSKGWGSWTSLVGMRSLLQHADNYSAIDFEHGTIHFIKTKYDAGGYSRRFDPCQTGGQTPFGGIVWRNEIHSLHAGLSRNVGRVTLGSKAWPPLAVKWGLVRSFTQVSIVVELDDNVAFNDINRIALHYRDGTLIDVEDFCDVVRTNIPQWVADIEKALEPQHDKYSASIRDYLRKLMREFRNEIEGLARDRSGSDLGDDGGHTQNVRTDANDDQSSTRNRGSLQDEGDKPASKRRVPIDAPRDEWVSASVFEDLGVGGMAAYFEQHNNVAFFNEEHTLFLSVVDAIAEKAPPNVPVSVAHDIAKRHAKNVVYATVGTHIAAALSMRSLGVSDELTIKMGFGAIVLTAVLATARLSRHFESEVAEARKSFRAAMIGSVEVA
jgi:hypothetical protein